MMYKSDFPLLETAAAVESHSHRLGSSGFWLMTRAFEPTCCRCHCPAPEKQPVLDPVRKTAAAIKTLRTKRYWSQVSSEISNWGEK